MSRPITLDDLYCIPVPADPQLSPDGDTVAYVVSTADRETDGYRSQIWTIARGGSPRQLTNGPHDGGPRFSPDGQTLAFVSARDGAAQLHLLPSGGGEPRRLTDLPGGVAEFAWAPDGRTLAVTATVDLLGDADDKERERRGTSPVRMARLGEKADGAGLLRTMRQHLFVVSADGGPARQLTFGDYSVGSIVWSPDGTQLAYAAAPADDVDLHPHRRIHLIPARGGPATPISPEDALLAPVDWSESAGLLAVGQLSFAVGHTELFTLAPTAGAEPILAARLDRNVMVGAPGYPGAPPRLLPDGRVLFCARDAGRVHGYVAPLGGDAGKIVGADDVVVTGLSWAAGRIAYTAATPATAGELHLAADDGTDDQRATSLFAEAVPEVALLRPEERTFRAPDGTPIHGWILRAPSTVGRSPLLLDIHGGPHNAWSPAFDGAHLYQQLLAAAGWTVLVLNPRGSDGYGADFYTAVSTAWGTADQDDFLTAVDDLVEAGLADPTRMAVTGYSYGGFMTCWLTAHTDRFAAAIAGGCVSDLQAFAGTSDVGRYLALLEVGVDRIDDAERYATHSPLTAVGNVRTPTLLLHGEADDRCPIGQAEQWFMSLRSNEVETELVRYPGASHLFILTGRPSHRVDYSRRVIDWVTRHVTAPENGPRLPERLLGLQQALDQLLREHDVPGAAVGVLLADQIEIVTSGVADLDTGAAVTPDTLFQIGSNTKVYTATLVMQLVDQGLVDLDAPVRRYLPELRLADEDAAAVITVRHLLTHTSGIDGDYFGPDNDVDDQAIERFVSSLPDIGLVHPVGEMWGYCNAGWVILGRLIERVTNTTYEQALRTRLLRPLGLTHTSQRADELLGHRLASGHVPTGPGQPLRVAPVHCLSWASAPAGSLLSATAADVLTFVRLHLDDGRTVDGAELVSPGSVKAMQSRQVDLPIVFTTKDGWGLGWGLGTVGGQRLLGHGGGTIGHVSTLEVLPDARLAVVVLTNAPGGVAVGRTIVDYLFDRLAGVQRPNVDLTEVTVPAAELDRYAGSYASRFTTVEVSVDDGLVAVVTTAPVPAMPAAEPTREEVRLRPLGDSRFAVAGTNPPQLVSFLAPDEEGRPGYLFNGRVLPRVKSADQAREWDSRYREREARWSGRPNGRLVAEVSGLTPGRALDVGCGEGADAIWLARRGWTVTGIDISDVALSRARATADEVGAAVEWIRADVLQTPPSARSFDLVSLQYPALPKAAGEAAIRALLDTVRPGGVLLAVYHDLNDEHRDHLKARGVDPADYVGADDLRQFLAKGFTVELDAIEPRIDPPPDTPHVADVVLRARRSEPVQ
jgi:dipeptidyl aminopeptidase/acylaminoacyl peptidase/CubicO group peptidase (beta-lactamase class C family)/SAM-dependent methyltransferase